MTKASRVPVIGVLLIGVLCPPAPVSAQQRPAIADQIAKTYGLDSFGQIDAIRYTFNIDLAALKLKLSRSWVWEPKTDQISYEGKDMGGLQEGWTAAPLTGSPRNGRRQAAPSFLLERGRQAGGFEHLGEGAVSCRRESRWPRLFPVHLAASARRSVSRSGSV